MGDDFEQQVSRLAALADPTRLDLYRYVTAQSEPVSRDSAAAAVGVARHTAKFHLDRLVGEGFLVAEHKRLPGRAGPGAGRPTKQYRRSSRQVAVTVPERRYDLAGQLLARAVDEARRDGVAVVDAVSAAAREAGAAVGERARVAAGRRPGRERLVRSTVLALRDTGYEPRQQGSTITLANCPFQDLARDHTELICGMNLALLAAAAGAVPAARLTARLDPEPGRCCVVFAHV